MTIPLKFWFVIFYILTDEVDLNHSKIDTGGKDINIDIDAVEGLLN